MLLTNAASLVHVVVSHPHLRPFFWINTAPARAVLTQGGLMFAISIASSCTYMFDNLLALHWLGAAASAQMTVALRVCTTATGMMAVIFLPYWPGFAEAITVGDRPWLFRAFRNGTLATIILAAAGSALIIVLGGSALRLWLHADLRISNTLLWAMAAWVFFSNVPYIPELLLTAALRLRPQLYVLTAVATAGFVLKFYAAKHFGVVGLLSIIPLLWLLFVVPIYFVLAWRWLLLHHGRKAQSVGAELDL
jgi:O-antigen/teichoic acid export membrane protein